VHLLCHYAIVLLEPLVWQCSFWFLCKNFHILL